MQPVDLRNEPKRIFAFGDIHGCLKELQALMKRVPCEPEDLLVFLGDYIDRGPDSRGVIDYLIDLGTQFPSSVFLKGNHEAMFLDYLAGRDRINFLFNGGGKTLQNYMEGDSLRVPRTHMDFFNRLEPFFETKNFIFVHAGLRHGNPLDQQREEDLLWIREEFIETDYDWGKTVVFGHTPQPEPRLTPNKIGLDTGAVYGHSLSCCEVRQRLFWSVPSQHG